MCPQEKKDSINPNVALIILALLLAVAPAWAQSLEFEYPGIRVVKIERGWDTLLRADRPDVVHNRFVLPMMRSRRIDASDRDWVAAFRFNIPEDLQRNIEHANLRFYTPGSGDESFKISVFGIPDGSLGDGEGSILDYSWQSAPWTTKQGLDDWIPLGSIHYQAGFQGVVELSHSPEFVNFLNQDTNRYITILLQPEVVEGKDFALTYHGSWEAEFEGRIIPTLELSQSLPDFQIGDRFMIPKIEYCDPETGSMVRQLTILPGLNQGFYYHDNPVSEDREWVVYRNIQGQGKAITSQYFMVNVRTGETKTLTEKGYSGGGELRGEWFYHLRAAGPDDFRISRTNIQTFEREDLYHGFFGFAVNADQSKLIVNKRKLLPGGDPTSIRSENFLTTLIAIDLKTGTERKLFTETIRVSHLQCSPTDPDIYHFIENNPAIMPDVTASTRALLFGSISTGAWGPLVTDDAFIDSFKNFAHPWWGPDGRFWSDTMKQAHGDTGGFVGNGIIVFDLSSPPPGPYPAKWAINSFRWFSANNVDWQHHANRTDIPYWHVGEGADPRAHRAGNRGRPFIQLFYANRDTGKAEFFPLSRQHWDVYVGIAGYAGANPHFLSLENGVVFQDRLDLEGVSMRTMNLFQVIIPAPILNRINSDFRVK